MNSGGIINPTKRSPDKMSGLFLWLFINIYNYSSNNQVLKVITETEHMSQLSV